MSEHSVPDGRPWLSTGDEAPRTRRTRALEHAVDYAMQAPSLHHSRPWQISVSTTGLAIRADRGRQLVALDPRGRELVLSAGAALLNARVALAERGWAAEVARLPDPEDPDLLAEVHPVLGPPDVALALLAPTVIRDRTNRRRFTCPSEPDAALRRLTAIAELDGVVLVPVVDESHRQLIDRLTRRADALQYAEGAGRTDLLSPRAVDTGGGGLPPDPDLDGDQTTVLLATRTDDQLAWLRAGEALQHVLLELTRLGWVGVPLTPAIQVPLTRTQLRAALTWAAHPQILLRIGPAASTAPMPRRQRSSTSWR